MSWIDGDDLDLLRRKLAIYKERCDAEDAYADYLKNSRYIMNCSEQIGLSEKALRLSKAREAVRKLRGE